jgi:MFS family permease
MSETASASAPQGGPRVGAYAFFVLFLLFLATYMNYFDRAILAVLQEPLKRDLGLQDAQLGIVSGPAFALLYSVAGIPIARLADRTNRSALLAAALGVWSAMSAACGFAQNFVTLALCRMGVGMGEGGSMPTSVSLIADYFPVERRGIAMSVLSAGGPVSALSAPIIGGLVAHAWGWRAGFWVAAAPGLLMVPLIAITLKDPRRGAKAAAERGRLFADLGWFRANASFAWTTAAAAFNAMATVGIAAFMVSYLVRRYGLDLPHAGGVVGLMGAFGMGGSLLGGLVADRLSGRTQRRSYLLVPAGSALIAGVFMLTAFLSDGWVMTLPALIGAGLFQDMKNGPVYASVQNMTPPRLRATASALLMFGATAVGGGSGPLIVGLVSDHSARGAFGAAGNFAIACKGGHAAAGAPHALASACASASAQGLHTAVTVACVFYAIAATCYFLASRGVKPAEGEPAAA